MVGCREETSVARKSWDYFEITTVIKKECSTGTSNFLHSQIRSPFIPFPLSFALDAAKSFELLIELDS